MRNPENCIAIYSRKSKFTGKGESIGNQVELCKEYIKVHYGEEALRDAVIYEDEGFSGGNLNRPAFKEMMAAVKERKHKAIIVYRLDRISRNISDFSGLIEELSYLNVAFISIREQFDTGSPMGRAMMYIASVFSQLERETIAERIRDNMHELAKTGRWLGGTTPTGYASESVKSITVDGKTKKACKLKIIPQEIEIIKTIFDVFAETNSLTITEAELMRRRLFTKNNKHFTRFAIKAILQNPVYMIADEDAYRYFQEQGADLFSDREAFDGTYGIMAYNRTDQEKGKTTVYLPIDKWIVSVGGHKGVIPGKVWVQVQKSLEQNKSKSFRRPRSNEALLTGLLFCRCGSRMYPKMTQRMTADGKRIYTYVCKMKERSQKSVCDGKNVNGNTLDMAVVEQIKRLEEDRENFIRLLEQSRKFYTSNHDQYDTQLISLRQKQEEKTKKINGLVDSLTEVGDGSAKSHIAKRIEELHRECEAIDARIQELERLTSQQELSDVEFHMLRQLLSVFRDSIDEMSIEQKRAAIRTVVRKVVWDGTNVHVILFGAAEGDIDFSEANEEDSDTLRESKTHRGADSK